MKESSHDSNENLPTTTAPTKDDETGEWPQELKDRAKSLVLQGLTVKKAAREVGVPMRTVLAWSTKDKWVVARSKIRGKADTALEKRIEELISKNLERHVKDGIEITQAVHRRIRTILETFKDDLDPMDLQRLTSALAKSHQVSEKTLGVGKKDKTGPQKMSMNVFLVGRATKELTGAMKIAEGEVLK